MKNKSLFLSCDFYKAEIKNVFVLVTMVAVCFFFSFSLFLFTKLPGLINIRINKNHSQVKSSQQDADEGFASSSSIEEDQAFEVLRRKRINKKTIDETSLKTSNMDKKSPVSMIAKLEHLLWAVSFVWVFYKLYTCGLNYIEWGIILWMGIYLVNSTKETIHDTSDQSSADEHNDIYDNDKKPIVPTLSRYRIFGASNSSFR